MDKKIKRILYGSFISGAVVCVVVFVFLITFMSNRTKKTIEDITSIYMSEINQQLQQKFTSIIKLRLAQVEGIIEENPTETFTYTDQMLESMTDGAKVRRFSYLGFYTEDGEMEAVFGEDLHLVMDIQKINSDLENNNSIIEKGVNQQGEKFLLLGKEAEYQLEDGRKSKALVAGVSMEYLSSALFLDETNTQVYSHIIDQDGNYVIRNEEEYRMNYFDRFKNIADSLDNEGVKNNIEEYLSGLKNVIETGTALVLSLYYDKGEKYVYCSALSENSTWYLLTVMDVRVISDSMEELGKWRVGVMVVSSLFIIFTMMTIFILYYRLSQRQMRKLEETREVAFRASQAKSEFLSSMSHDIRTPMNAIIGMTEIALKNVKDPVRVEDCLGKVRLSSKHLLGLINDVLDMSKIESGKMTLNMDQISLRETMDDMVNIVQPQVKERNQYFDIFIHDIQTENVYCDSVRLNQVLLNLLSNALKFTPEEGRINIRMYQDFSPLGEEYVCTHFWVEDDGIGMSEEFQKKIFESFTREETEKVQKIGGTGLGMSITKAIIDLMGGEIELYSELGKGSKFHIILNLKKSSGEDDMKLPEWNILVVDDNEQLCISAVANLEELGVHAEWTQDSEKAVRMVEEHYQRKEDYHFVLIDWKMPKMDGLQTIREIQKKIKKKVPVFLISAYDWSDIEDEVQSAEIEGFIAKPLFKSTLYFRLSQYVEGNHHNNVSEQVQDQAEVDFTGKHILLAEDIDLNWEIANEVLTSFGFEVTRAINGKECIEKFEESAIGYYDVVLMDIRMPVMNGYDATKGIRALERSDKELPIIAMTADAFEDDVQVCLDCGMNGHIAKPIDIKQLMDLLKKFLT